MGLLRQESFTIRKIAPENTAQDATIKETKHNEIEKFPSTTINTVEDDGLARNLMFPSCFDCLDDMLIFSLFRGDIDIQERGYHYGIGKQVEVKVQVRSCAK